MIVTDEDLDENGACKRTDRGILKTDGEGILKNCQRKRLKKATQKMRVPDRRDWQALRQVRPAAQRVCTEDYQTTVMFESLGSEFVITKFDAEHFGLEQIAAT